MHSSIHSVQDSIKFSCLLQKDESNVNNVDIGFCGDKDDGNYKDTINNENIINNNDNNKNDNDNNTNNNNDGENTNNNNNKEKNINCVGVEDPGSSGTVLKVSSFIQE